jgi:erythromycin esterase-like protein
MSAQQNTENLTIHCKVKDYATWRTAYDAHDKDRHSAGLTNGRVYRRAEDPNDVVVVLDASDVAKARTWFGSPEQKAIMEKGGVIGSASLRFAA